MLNERSIPNWLLAVLRCPITYESFAHRTSRDGCNYFRPKLEEVVLSNRLGRTISEVSTQGLVNESNSWFYEIRDSVSQLMPDDAIPVEIESVNKIRTFAPDV